MAEHEPGRVDNMEKKGVVLFGLSQTAEYLRDVPPLYKTNKYTNYLAEVSKTRCLFLQNKKKMQQELGHTRDGKGGGERSTNVATSSG